MENYVFVCIGTNRLIEDSFGPRVGNILECNFNKFTNIKVLGTMKSPIHFQNAHIFLNDLKLTQRKLILIDSALGEEEKIGNTYVNFGGTEIGKAFGKSLYFPAHINIKTVVGIKPNIEYYEVKDIKQIENDRNKNDELIKNMSLNENMNKIVKTKRINQLAKKLAIQITESVYQMI